MVSKGWRSPLPGCALTVLLCLLHSGSVDALERTVKVHKYDLFLEPYFKYPGFDYDKAKNNHIDGKVSIQFSVLQPNDTVDLHAWLSLENSTLRSGDRQLEVKRVAAHGADRRLLVQAAQPFQPGQTYTLNFEFHNNMETSALFGGFVHEWYGPYENTTYFAFSQFSPNFARRIFPCWDDPFFRSVFTVTVAHPSNAVAVSSTDPAMRTKYDALRDITQFKPTMPISTLSLSIAVGDFVSVEGRSASGVKVRAIAARPFRERLPEVVDIGVQCLNGMEELIGYKYPLEKLDHLSTIFRKYHMQGFGLVIHSSDLLPPFNLSTTESWAYKARICRETVRQWLGDMVTVTDPKDWTLDAYAELFETAIIRKFPGLKEFADDVDTVYNLDALNNALRPTEPTIKTGGGMLRQFKAVLGEERFFAAVSAYAKQFAFAEGSSVKLLQALEKAGPISSLCGDITLASFMRDYERNHGLPLVNITLDKSGYRFNQSSAYFPYFREEKWSVPMFVYDVAGGKEHLVWLQKPHNFQLKPDGAYVFGNGGKTYAQLVLKSREILERVFATDLSRLPTQALRYLRFYMVERNGAPWADSKDWAGRVFPKLVRDHRGKVNPSVVKGLWYKDNNTKPVVQDILRSFNYNDKSARNAYLGELILPLAVTLGIPQPRLQRLIPQFVKDCDDPDDVRTCSKILPDWRLAVYMLAAQDKQGRETLNTYRSLLTQHKFASQKEVERVTAALKFDPEDPDF